MIPKRIINQINKFKKIRADYENFYEQWLVEQEKQKAEIKTSITSSSYFTLDELMTLSLSLELKDKKQENTYSVMLATVYPHRFTNFDNDKYQIHDYHDNHKSHSTIKVKLTPQERYKKMFINAVHLINNLNIHIYNIECLSNNFIFHCQKNNIKLSFSCYLSDSYCDCELGYLTIENTINDFNKEEIKHDIVFDLSHPKDTNDYSYIKFIRAINGDSMATIKQELYSHIIALPTVLNYEVEVKDGYFNTDNQEEIENYKIRINKKCVLTPINHDTIYLSEKECDNYYRKGEYYEIKYKSLKDLNSLCTYIDAFLDRLHNYGYGGNDLSFIKQFPNLKINVAKDVNNLSGFDLFVVLNGYQEDKEAIMTYFKIPKISKACILDYYGIRFVYDKKIDPLNCILTIDCQYCDISKLTPSDHYVPYHHQLKSYDYLKIHDSYDNCVKVIEELIYLLEK